MADESALISRVRIENYKSIAACDVRLGSLAMLVGRNGSGKSNFLDALRFVADALRIGLDQAVRDRGGIGNVRHRFAPAEATVAIDLELRLPFGDSGSYGFRLGSQPNGGYRIVEEHCAKQGGSWYEVRDGKVTGYDNMLAAHAPLVSRDRLFLVSVANSPVYRPVYEFLVRMAFYHPDPVQMRIPRPHDDGALLTADGGNAASVLRRLMQEAPDDYRRIEEYLRAVLPRLRGLRVESPGNYDVIEFAQGNGSAASSQLFVPLNMSDGTLRLLAILIALLQRTPGSETGPTVIGIEEPELAIHPAALAVLRDALRDAAEICQVLVTTQSADLLDSRDILAEEILVVADQNGASAIGPIAEEQRAIIREHLATAGELLRTSDYLPRVPAQPATAGTDA